MDVKSAFLNGFMEKEVYVRQPPGFEHPKFPNRVFKLQKALYGLKQAPGLGMRDLRNFWLTGMESVDKTLFLLKHGKDLLIVQIYVDDIIFGDSSHALCSKFSEQMSREFEMSMMGELQQTPQGTFVHQSKYTRDLLRKFEMADASPHMTPMSTSTALDADEDGKEVDQKVYRGMIGSLLYLIATRPDIQFAIGLCARFQASPRESHRTTVKRILRYIKFTPEFGLWYSADSSLSLLGFSDSDHAGCQIDRKSTSGTCQFLGTSLVSWSSRKQSSVATSTCEAEYVAAASCCSQILWMLATLRDYGLTYGRIPILCDSSSAISVAKNPVLHSRTKHIDVRYHFLRDNYEKGMIDIVKVASENQEADILTKHLDLETFARLRGELGNSISMKYGADKKSYAKELSDKNSSPNDVPDSISQEARAAASNDASGATKRQKKEAVVSQPKNQQSVAPNKPKKASSEKHQPSKTSKRPSATKSEANKNTSGGSPWTKENPKYLYGKPMLTRAELEVAGPGCVELHAYYMKSCATDHNKNGIVVEYKCMLIEAKEKALPVGFLDPQLLSVTAMEFDRSSVVDYVTKGLRIFGKKEYIMFGHNTGGHWILV
ncbi:LOW QUALITY PROTEIN: hypothetical protein U9M48_031593, partial [Paspalum notatum var. saurae]